MQYSIYQLKSGHKYKFMGYDSICTNTTISINDYNKVYVADMDTKNRSITEVLENIFTIYNIYIPKDFPGHSLSISDVIHIFGDYYYIDSFGFKKLDKSFCETEE